MDEMKLKLHTKMLKGMMATIMSKLVFKKFGFKPEIRIDEFDIEMVDGKILFHINANGEVDENSIIKATRLIDLD